MVAKNLAELRRVRQLTVRDLAEELNRLGHPMLPSAITKIENRQRRVDVDDLVALAVALNVSPSRLLLPPHDEPAYKVDLTPSTTVPRTDAWAWALGEEPLPERLNGIKAAFNDRWQEYTRATMPHSRVAASLKPVVRAIRLLAREVGQYIADRESFEAHDGLGPVPDPKAMRRALGRVLLEFTDLIETGAELAERIDSPSASVTHTSAALLLRVDLAGMIGKLTYLLRMLREMPVAQSFLSEDMLEPPVIYPTPPPPPFPL